MKLTRFLSCLPQKSFKARLGHGDSCGVIVDGSSVSNHKSFYGLPTYVAGTYIVTLVHPSVCTYLGMSVTPWLRSITLILYVVEQ